MGKLRIILEGVMGILGLVYLTALCVAGYYVWKIISIFLSAL